MGHILLGTCKAKKSFVHNKTRRPMYREKKKNKEEEKNQYGV